MTSFGRQVFDSPNSPEWPLRACDAVVPLPRNYGYDVALSFAGEDREVARIIAHMARANGLRVFFDEYHVWETWGKDLSDYLGSIYGGGARYCVILISKDYCRKPYTILERRLALGHALEIGEEYILPVILDDSWPPGLPRTTAYLDLRTMQPTEIAEAVIRKIRGQNWEIRHAKDQVSPKFEALEAGMSGLLVMNKSTWPGLIDFADVTIAHECRLWAEGDPFVRDSWSSEPARWSFRGGSNAYEDPIFDITILNRSGMSRLITRIGIETLGASHLGHDAYGGGPAESVLLHRTYQIPVPDLWRTLADAYRAAGYGRLEAHGRDRRPLPWIDATERSSCRLPDPILVDPGRAYRFGLHLFDYTDFCPTEVELLFWMQTDQGEAKSERARLSYFIGSDIPPRQRYIRMLEGSFGERASNRSIEQIAYSLWESAGRPPGQDQYFWMLAKQTMREDSGLAESMMMAHKRTLLGRAATCCGIAGFIGL
jgi:TIR domain/Protein of unknown function (DUF2934)